MANANEILNAFNSTKNAKELQNKINSIKHEIHIAKKHATKEYSNKVDSIPSDYSIPRRNRRNEECFKEYKANLKAIDEKYADTLAELENKLNAKFENFSKEIKGNEAWNDIIHRKSVPQILAELEKSDLTEEQMEIEINGELSDSAKCSRYGFPIAHLEELSWIKRSGSGKVGDAMVSRLTTEGKRQLDFYRNNKMFDCSNVIM